MEITELECLYRKYLLDFLNDGFDAFIETEVLSLEEFRNYLCK